MSTFNLKIQGEQPPPAPYGEKVRHTPKNVTLNVITGALDDQFDTLLAQDESIGASGTKAIDLQDDLDRYGVALTATDVALLYLEHKSTSASSGITLAAGVANGFTNLMATTAAVTLVPGVFKLVGALAADALVVSGTNKTLLITNLDGSNAADYVLHVWMRK